MKKKIIGMAFLAVLSGNCFAQNSGTRGGGHVIEVNGQLELVDIVTNATCDWFTGAEIKQQSNAINQILKKIEKLDWYLALELKREIEFISWCMTGNLYSVPAGDPDSFVKQLTRGVQQAAFRYNGNAYIDQSKYLKLTPNSQAYLIFHEMLHSYLPMHLQMRIFKLQSLVSTIRKVDLGQITTRESLHFNLAKNDFDFPLTVSKLDPYKKSIQFVLSSTEERMREILATLEPEKLIHVKIQNSLPYVAKWDREAIQQIDRSITEPLKEIFRSQNLKQVQFILHEQMYKRINPAAVGLSIYEELSPEIQKEITASSYFLQIIKEGPDYLNSISFSITNGRILGDLALQSISGDCKKITPTYTTSLTVLNDQCPLPIKVQAIADIMVFLAEAEENDVLRNQLENNHDFIQALRMEKAIEAIKGLTPPIGREKELAITVVKEIQKELVNLIKANVRERLSRPSPIIENIFNKL